MKHSKARSTEPEHLCQRTRGTESLQASHKKERVAVKRAATLQPSASWLAGKQGSCCCRTLKLTRTSQTRTRSQGKRVRTGKRHLLNIYNCSPFEKNGDRPGGWVCRCGFPWGPHGGRREPTLTSCPLTSTQAPWHMHVGTHNK